MSVEHHRTDCETEEALEARIHALREQGRLVEAHFAQFELNWRQSLRDRPTLAGEP